jgi:3-hydroxyisobutyrate dehydrogenase-like beta-hydroxyacid dehydrogenase
MNTTSDTLRVGFIGLGRQGGPMARRIIEAGHPVTLLRLADVIADGSGNSFALEPVASAGGTLARIGEHAVTLLAAADAALALMNVSR